MSCADPDRQPGRQPGRTGGYCLDKARTPSPVNLTPGEAVAMAVALRRRCGGWRARRSG
jgi:predicted DNA-binding transcriptional regulator YafY